MRVNNKKYLLIILLVGVILTGVFLFKPQKEEQLNEVVLKDEISNEAFAMYKEEGESYTKIEDNKFPERYVLNVKESKCIDNNGNEIKDALSYENDKVVLKSNRSSYCYLYFDKSLGEEIKEQSPNGLKTDAVRGAMYRYQGQATEEINNYICFGTSDKSACTQNKDKYMYRIIGIEAETGRVKVIKMEALDQPVQWYTDYDHDIKFPQSKIYETISGEGFLENPNYVPEGWSEKISTNTWTYGDMWSNDTLGAKQTGEGLYQTETGQKDTQWYNHATQDTPGAKQATVGYEPSEYRGQIVYYTDGKGKWTETFKSKISLMYLHDYHYSVSDEANCQYDEHKYETCQKGWMHLSQNDTTPPSPHEWTMSRYGWNIWGGVFYGHSVSSAGYTSDAGTAYTINSLSVRPVFYLTSVNQLSGGSGTSEDPFILN